MNRDELSAIAQSRLPRGAPWAAVRAAAAGIALGTALVWLVGAGDLLQERREQVRRMTPEAQARLRESLRRFQELDGEAQKNLRRIHRELEEAPDREELRAVMRRYGQWLARQPMTTQCELAEMTPEERLSKIQSLLDEEQDTRGVQSWLREHVRRVVRALPKEEDREQTRGGPNPGRRDEVMRILFGALDNRGAHGEAIEQAMADLRSRVSPSRASLLAAEPLEKQVQWVREWVQNERRERWWQQLLDRTLNDIPTQPSDAELAEFLDRLKPDERDRILAMPSEEMYQRLQELYRVRQRIEQPWPGGGQRPPGGPRPWAGPPRGGAEPADRPPGPPPNHRRDSPPPP